MDANAIVDKIIREAEQKVRSDLKVISSKIKEDFVSKAKEVVLLYYSNYPDPVLYKRTGNLKGGVIDDSFNSFKGSEYGASIQFSPSGMSDYTDGGDKGIVVKSFMSGIHGRPSVQVDSPSATDLMNNFQNGYKKTLDSYFIGMGYRVNS